MSAKSLDGVTIELLKARAHEQQNKPVLPGRQKPKYSACLEEAAHAYGFKDWNTAAACLPHITSDFDILRYVRISAEERERLNRICATGRVWRAHRSDKDPDKPGWMMGSTWYNKFPINIDLRVIVFGLDYNMVILKYDEHGSVHARIDELLACAEPVIDN